MEQALAVVHVLGSAYDGTREPRAYVKAVRSTTLNAAGMAHRACERNLVD